MHANARLHHASVSSSLPPEDSLSPHARSEGSQSGFPCAGRDNRSACHCAPLWRHVNQSYARFALLRLGEESRLEKGSRKGAKVAKKKAAASYPPLRSSRLGERNETEEASRKGANARFRRGAPAPSSGRGCSFLQPQFLPYITKRDGGLIRFPGFRCT